MFYSKSKSKNKIRWSDPFSHAKNGLACISSNGNNRAYSIHRHLDLSLVTGCIRTSEEEMTDSRQVIKEPICSHEGQSHASKILDQVLKEANSLDQEIENLKSQITSLRENKQELEAQILLYKEQESMVWELQSLVEEKAAEIDSLNRKVECLQSENHRLKLLAAEHASLKVEMESERMKMKKAQNRIEKSWRKKKEAMVKLRQQLAVQKARETEVLRESEMKKIIECLHGEIDELKSANSELLNDKIELMNKMDCVMESLTAEKEATKMAIEEATRMRIANAELSKQMEMYRNDRRADIEELIYLRWINACLKHELKKKHRPKEKNSSTKHASGEKAVPERGVDEQKCSGYDSDYSSTTATEMIDSSGAMESKRTKTSKPKLIHKIKKWVNSSDRSKKVYDEDRCSAPADESVKVRSSHSYENVSSCGKLDYATDVMVLPRSRKFLFETAMS